jgi:GNAT superfamily N-acetyltransferase
MIRAASTPDDFELCASIFNAVSTDDDRVTGSELAVAGGDCLIHGTEGYAFAKPSSVAGATYAMVRVRPEARRAGVGSALLAAVRERARPRLWGRVRDDDGGARRFASVHDFAEVGHDVAAVLQVAAGDGERRREIVELTDEHLPGAYEVVAEAMPETALPQVAEAEPYERWVQREQRPSKAVTFVALDGVEVVGYAGLTLLDGMPWRVENYLTAVRRSHRGRGIATALKRAEIAWAAERGFTEIVTEMVEANGPMRALNRKLGYVEQPGWIVVEGAA